MRPPTPLAVIWPDNSAVLLVSYATTLANGNLYDDSNHKFLDINVFTDSENEKLRDRYSIRDSFGNKQELIKPTIERLEKWSACQQFFPPWLSKETQASLENILEETVDVLDSEVVNKKTELSSLFACFRSQKPRNNRKTPKNGYKHKHLQVDSQDSPIKLKKSPIKGMKSQIELKKSRTESQESPIKSKDSPIKSKDSPIKSKDSPIKSKESPIKWMISPIKWIKSQIESKKWPNESQEWPIESKKLLIEWIKSRIEWIKSRIESQKSRTEPKFATIEGTDGLSLLTRTLRQFADSIGDRFLETDSLVAKSNGFMSRLMPNAKRTARAQNMLVQYQVMKSVRELVRSSVDLEYIPPSMAITLEYCKGNSKPKKYAHILSPIYDLALPGTECLRQNIAAIRLVVEQEYLRYSPDRFKVGFEVDVTTLNEQQCEAYLDAKMKVISSILSGKETYISRALLAVVADEAKSKANFIDCECQELTIVEIAMIKAKSVKFCDLVQTLAKLLKSRNIELPDYPKALVDGLYRPQLAPTKTTISMLTASPITHRTRSTTAHLDSCSTTAQSDTCAS